MEVKCVCVYLLMCPSVRQGLTHHVIHMPAHAHTVYVTYSVQATRKLAGCAVQVNNKQNTTSAVQSKQGLWNALDFKLSPEPVKAFR